jgi:parallel beta-helix repeat protein
MEREKKMVLEKRIVSFVMGMLLISILGSIFFTDCSTAAGDTIYVDDSGGADYTHIQEAINAAGLGDTVYVYSGTYNENIVITKDLILIGENKDTTFIDGGDHGHTLNAHEPTDGEIHVSVSGFTIRNAGGSGFDGITFSYVTDSVISNNKIVSNQGEGIQLDHCQAITVSNNYVYNNMMAGVSVTLSEENLIQDNIIQDNQKGIHIASYSNNNEITGNSIRNNTEAGIYIFANSNNNVITSNTIWKNDQYGVYIMQSTGNIFSLNDFNRLKNNPSSKNAQDTAVNSWNHNNQGNYWDDYNAYDTDSNGIGDTPYNIPGGDNKDNYPLGDFLQPEQPGDENDPPIVLSLSVSPLSAVSGETVTFEGMGFDSDGTVEGYHWRSNINGTLSFEQSFSTTTLAVGVHTIYFQVQDNEGDWSEEDTEIVTIEPKPNNKPIAYIDEITPISAKQGQTILFRGHGSDIEGPIIAYKWISSKDGSISTASNFSSTELSIGTHTIYFQVKDMGNEWSKQVTSTLVIEKNSSSGDPTNQAPTAEITGSYQGETNKALTFDGSGSSDNDGSVTAYLWDFGDEMLGTGISPTHTYTTPGTYTVTLQVTDDDGATNTTSTSVTVVQSTSHGDNLGSISVFDIEIPFPLIILMVFLIVLGVITYFIMSLKRR